MPKSMTGFGKSSARAGSFVFTVEIRTLNSKTLDVNLRLPVLLREKESLFRAEIAKVLERGKVDFVVSSETEADAATPVLNKELIRQYYVEFRKLAAELGENPAVPVLHTILSMPEVLNTAREISLEEHGQAILDAVQDALRQTDEFRLAEGSLLAADMQMRIQLILNLLNEIEPLEGERIRNLRERFQRNQNEFLDLSLKTEKFDENRFEQEIFWYLEKLDITEEKLRLHKHCDYFLATLQSSENAGRKLGFICQEIGREVNTLGSKAYNADIQMIVVQMKDELEKIKEQVANVL
jgi:uncharacterized protein (TIGR00255 family)